MTIVRTPEITDRYLALLNDMLIGAQPLGAYVMGGVSAAAWSEGFEPDHQLLHNASKASSVLAIEPIFQAWKRKRSIKK